MEDNSLAVVGLCDAASATCKHGRPTDLYTECWGCELGLSINNNSHTCFTVAGPAFNRIRTSVDTDISTQVAVPLSLPCFPLLMPLLTHQFCNLCDLARHRGCLNGQTERPALENNQGKENQHEVQDSG